MRGGEGLWGEMGMGDTGGKGDGNGMGTGRERAEWVVLGMGMGGREGMGKGMGTGKQGGLWADRGGCGQTGLGVGMRIWVGMGRDGEGGAEGWGEERDGFGCRWEKAAVFGD